GSLAAHGDAAVTPAGSSSRSAVSVVVTVSRFACPGAAVNVTVWSGSEGEPESADTTVATAAAVNHMSVQRGARAMVSPTGLARVRAATVSSPRGPRPAARPREAAG